LFEGKKGQEAWEWLVSQIEKRRSDPRAAASEPRLLDLCWNDPLLFRAIKQWVFSL